MASLAYGVDTLHTVAHRSLSLKSRGHTSVSWSQYMAPLPPVTAQVLSDLSTRSRGLRNCC